LLFGLFFKQRKYFFDHFIISAELNSFLVAFGFLLFPGLILFVNWFGRLFDNEFHFFLPETSLGIIIGGVFLLDILFAVKKYYNQSWLWTILKSLLFLALFIYIINPFYRIILFFTTLLFV